MVERTPIDSTQSNNPITNHWPLTTQFLNPSDDILERLERIRILLIDNVKMSV